jgi:predicted small lipoprotein YifL
MYPFQPLQTPQSSRPHGLKAGYTGDRSPLSAPRNRPMCLFCPGSLLTGLLLAALLAGCGQKGPLYLPKLQAQPPADASSSPATP